MADSSAKAFMTVSSSTSAGPHDRPTLVIADQNTGVEFRAQMIDRVRGGQFEQRRPPVTSTTFELI